MDTSPEGPAERPAGQPIEPGAAPQEPAGATGSAGPDASAGPETASAPAASGTSGAGTGPRRGRVRLRRFAALGVPGVLAAAALVVATAQGVLGAQFAISGMSFTITADHLHGEGMEQYGALDTMVPGSPLEGDTGGQVVVFVSAIRSAQITGMCQSVQLGGSYLKITAGDRGKAVSATDLTTDSTLLTGSQGEFGGLEMGRDASTLDKAKTKGPIGTFGQQADSVDITDLHQENWATTAARLKLPHLRIAFSSDDC